MILAVSAANLIVGTLIGVSGIAGFLLPIFFSGFLGLALPDTLALSFLSFLTSGLLGAWSYHRAGNLDWRLSIPLCAGSLLGTLVGVRLNLLIPTGAAKVLLYTVVLFSGLSVLFRKDRKGADSGNSHKAWLLLLLGVVTAAVCSLTGAGGPILVVPLLAGLGVELRTAVGVSLLDSVAIALPACIGYFSQATMEHLLAFCIASVVFHGIGVLTGAKLSGRINLKALKLVVGLISVCAACYMLLQLAFY